MGGQLPPKKVYSGVVLRIYSASASRPTHTFGLPTIWISKVLGPPVIRFAIKFFFLRVCIQSLTTRSFLVEKYLITLVFLCTISPSDKLQGITVESKVSVPVPCTLVGCVSVALLHFGGLALSCRKQDIMFSIWVDRWGNQYLDHHWMNMLRPQTIKKRNWRFRPRCLVSTGLIILYLRFLSYIPASIISGISTYNVYRLSRFQKTPCHSLFSPAFICYQPFTVHLLYLLPA